MFIYMKITQVGEGWNIGEKFYFGPEVMDDRVSLSLTKGDIMKYGEETHMHIDFPGEYDVKGVSIVCIDSNDRLHYMVHGEWLSFCVAQHRGLLDAKNLWEAETWLVTDESIKSQLESMEMEGKVIVLGAEEESEEAAE